MRKRSLSDDERALWDSVAKQAKPLRKKTRMVLASPLPAGDRSMPKASGEGALRREKSSPLTPILSAAGRGSRPALAAKPRPVASIERREKSRLARGVRDIDARLDLHGMTQARAHRALLSFLRNAQDDGYRYVLVITGKGKMLADGSERGVLRRQVPEWLTLADFRVLVSGYEEAAVGHGGGGALYVRLRRGGS